MNIYYKRETIWCKYPWQSEVDRTWVDYSKSKKKFSKQIFLSSNVDLDMKERTEHVATALGIKPNKVKLIKF